MTTTTEQPSMDEVVTRVVAILCREGLTTAAVVLNAAWAQEKARAARASSTPDPRDADLTIAPVATAAMIEERAREEGRKAGIEEAKRVMFGLAMRAVNGVEFTPDDIVAQLNALSAPAPVPSSGTGLSTQHQPQQGGAHGQGEVHGGGDHGAGVGREGDRVLLPVRSVDPGGSAVPEGDAERVDQDADRQPRGDRAVRAGEGVLRRLQLGDVERLLRDARERVRPIIEREAAAEAEARATPLPPLGAPVSSETRAAPHDECPRGGRHSWAGEVFDVNEDTRPTGRARCLRCGEWRDVPPAAYPRPQGDPDR